MANNDRVTDKLGDNNEAIPFRYEINSYGIDFPVDGLVKRIRKGDVYIPSFQRGFVWTNTQASRFIESLLLGLPVPGIFLSKDFQSQRLLVIDGQQRLKTLLFFYEGEFADSGRIFKLNGVQPRFEGATYTNLSEEDRRKLDNSIIHATIVRQERPPNDDSSIYSIFERLNTSGVSLSPQEIRSAIYQGKFKDLLKDLNENENWRNIYGRTNKRMKDQELILRFFALLFNEEKYKKPMKDFLNNFMAANLDLQTYNRKSLSDAFSLTIEYVNNILGRKAFRPIKALNVAVFDSIMVGLFHRLKKGEIRDQNNFKRVYSRLLKSENYLDVTLESTADERNVHERIRLATEIFANIK